MNPTNPSNSFTPIIPIDPTITLVHHFLERSARLYPDKVAIIHGKVRATYSEINTRADNLAHYLQSIATQKGDRVALLMENCVEYVISYYGIMKAGAVAVPLNSDLKPEGLRYAIEDLEARTLIASQRFQKLIDPFRFKLPRPHLPDPQGLFPLNYSTAQPSTPLLHPQIHALLHAPWAM